MNGHRRTRFTALALLLAMVAMPMAASDTVVVQQPAEMPLLLATGQQKLLRSRENIQRTAVTDASVCGVNQFSAGEFAIVARSPGRAQVTVWFAEVEKEPLVYVVEVR